MASISSWTRLEPRVRDPQLHTSLAVQIRDPLWMLSRQWQIGEFLGHYGGSIVLADLKINNTILNRFHHGLSTDGEELSGQSYNPSDLPLETVVEQEHACRNPEKSLHLAAEAGLHFLRLLARECSPTDYPDLRNTILEEFPLQMSDNSVAASEARLMANRAPDGRTLYEVLRSDDEYWSSAADCLNNVAIIWLEWYEQLYPELSQGDAAWVNERLEYQFAVSAPSYNRSSDYTIVADEYSDGHLDWYSFDYDPDRRLSTDATTAQTNQYSLQSIPTHVISRGMPSDRWWGFEDAGIDAGAVEAAPEDLIRLSWMQFILHHANDWLIIPVDLPIGSLSKVTSLSVKDSFGRIFSIPSINEHNNPSHKLFKVTKSKNEESSPPFDLFLPPILGPSLHSEPIEKVQFLRDEMANMAWAIEASIEGSAGRPIHRQETLNQQIMEDSFDHESSEGAEVVYRLFSTVPENWIPFLPVPNTKQLRRGRVQSLGGVSGDPLGEILSSDLGGPFYINDEQVPRKGIRVQRAFRYARWVNGSTYLWIGRKKSAGKGQGSSGLAFDFIDPVEPKTTDQETSEIVESKTLGVIVNKASSTELQKIIHIGPVRAQKIIAHRESKPFSFVSDLKRVRGIGPRRIRDVIQQKLAYVGYEDN